METVLVTGGAGYVGSLLVPKLLKKYNVKVYDLYLYEYIFKNQKNLEQIHGDIRCLEDLKTATKNVDYIIHLASISNDPSFDLDPKLGKSINYDATQNIIDVCKVNDIKRLVVASSTSQYGIKPLDESVTESTTAEPITDYGKYKIMSEELIAKSDMDTEYVFARPSTLCGYAPRLRLDLIVNIMTIHALENNCITVFGGEQMRPVLNINDMIRLYELLLEAPSNKINGEAFNLTVGNMTATDIANVVSDVCGGTQIKYKSTDDLRSYHINADKVKKVLNFRCKWSVKDAVRSIIDAYGKGLINDGLNNPIYHNVKMMKKKGML